MRVDIPVGLPTVVQKKVSYVAVEEDYTGGLIIEVFDDLDKVGADVALSSRTDKPSPLIQVKLPVSLNSPCLTSS